MTYFYGDTQYYGVGGFAIGEGLFSSMLKDAPMKDAPLSFKPKLVGLLRHL